MRVLHVIRETQYKQIRKLSFFLTFFFKKKKGKQAGEEHINIYFTIRRHYSFVPSRMVFRAEDSFLSVVWYCIQVQFC